MSVKQLRSRSIPEERNSLVQPKGTSSAAASPKGAYHSRLVVGNLVTGLHLSSGTDKSGVLPCQHSARPTRHNMCYKQLWNTKRSMISKTVMFSAPQAKQRLRLRRLLRPAPAARHTLGELALHRAYGCAQKCMAAHRGVSGQYQHTQLVDKSVGHKIDLMVRSIRVYSIQTHPLSRRTPPRTTPRADHLAANPQRSWPSHDTCPHMLVCLHPHRSIQSMPSTKRYWPLPNPHRPRHAAPHARGCVPTHNSTQSCANSP